MTHLNARLLIVFAAALLPAIVVGAASQPREKIVQMPPFKVTDVSGEFELDIRIDEKTKTVKQIVVSWVGATAERFRMRVGDLLVTIDDKSVKGMLLDDVLRLRERRMKEGETQKLVFTGPGSNDDGKKITLTNRGLRPAVVLNTPSSEGSKK
jgi:C-terminal processing protease CtpA/Prc